MPTAASEMRATGGALLEAVVLQRCQRNLVDTASCCVISQHPSLNSACSFLGYPVVDPGWEQSHTRASWTGDIRRSGRIGLA